MDYVKEFFSHLRKAPSDLIDYYSADKYVLFDDGEISHVAALRTMSVLFKTENLWTQNVFDEIEQAPEHEDINQVYAGLFLTNDHALEIGFRLRNTFKDAEALSQHYTIAILYPFCQDRGTDLLVSDNKYAPYLAGMSWDRICDALFDFKPVISVCSSLSEYSPLLGCVIDRELYCDV